MRIEKTKSGKYRIQPTINGHRVSITFDYKPTQKEINQIIYERSNKTPKSTDKQTFKQLALKYIDMKSNVLSPATIRSYNGIVANLPDDFLNLRLCSINQVEIQTIINDKAASVSAKTCKNYKAFILAVLKAFEPNTTYRITLPSPEKSDEYIPTSEDIKKILDASKDTKWYIYFALGSYGLRRSEILALTSDDIFDDYIDINKTMVLDKDKKWIIKPLGKTAKSLRQVPISPELIKKIRKQGIEIDFYPDKILEHLHIYQKRLNLPLFTFHKLRHYFCTELSDAGISEEDIMALGGWSTPNIMKSVYRHQKIRDNKERQNEIAKTLYNRISDGS